MFYLISVCKLCTKKLIEKLINVKGDHAHRNMRSGMFLLNIASKKILFLFAKLKLDHI